MICPHDKKNSEYNDKWNGLGGKIQNGETPEEGAEREIYEESNFQVNKLKLAGFLTFPQIIKDEDWYCFVFTCSEFSGTMKESNEGNLEWIKNEEIIKKNLWEGDHIFLPYLFEGKLFSGKFFYEGGKLVNHSLITY